MARTKKITKTRLTLALPPISTMRMGLIKNKFQRKPVTWKKVKNYMKGIRIKEYLKQKQEDQKYIKLIADNEALMKSQRVSWLIELINTNTKSKSKSRSVHHLGENKNQHHNYELSELFKMDAKGRPDIITGATIFDRMAGIYLEIDLIVKSKIVNVNGSSSLYVPVTGISLLPEQANMITQTLSRLQNNGTNVLMYTFQHKKPVVVKMKQCDMNQILDAKNWLEKDCVMPNVPSFSEIENITWTDRYFCKACEKVVDETEALDQLINYTDLITSYEDNPTICLHYYGIDGSKKICAVVQWDIMTDPTVKMFKGSDQKGIDEFNAAAVLSKTKDNMQEQLEWLYEISICTGNKLPEYDPIDYVKAILFDKSLNEETLQLYRNKVTDYMLIVGDIIRQYTTGEYYY